MVQETGAAARSNLFWWLTLAYAALVGFSWLTLGLMRLTYWRSVMAQVNAAVAQGDIPLANRGRAFAGGIAVDMGFALATAAIFAFVAVALARRTWNAWDYATTVIGFVTVFASIFICARGRIMLFIPLTAAPLWALLYLPGTKAACHVGPLDAPEPLSDAPVTTLSRDEIEREITKERTLIMQLSQNLDVFEVERSMETDSFVARYTAGLEEENADNAEWFAIARAVRRSRERIVLLKAQLDAGSEG